MISSAFHFAIEWVVLTVAFLAAAAIVPGFEIKDAKSGFWVAAIFAVLNVVIGPLLVVAFGVFTLGLACLLPGLVRFLVTTIVIRIVAMTTDKLKVTGLFPAALAAIFMSVVPAMLEFAFSALR